MPEQEKPVVIRKPETESIETDLDRFIKFGVMEKEIEVMAGFKVTMHPLSQEEHEDLTKNIIIPKTDSDDTLFARLESFKIPSLTIAITKLNDQSFKNPEEKKVLKDQLLKAPTVLIDKLWITYSNLCKDQVDLINGNLKKN